jgi:hypothetical protein
MPAEAFNISSPSTPQSTISFPSNLHLYFPPSFSLINISLNSDKLKSFLITSLVTFNEQCQSTSFSTENLLKSFNLDKFSLAFYSFFSLCLVVFRAGKIPQTFNCAFCKQHPTKLAGIHMNSTKHSCLTHNMAGASRDEEFSCSSAILMKKFSSVFNPLPSNILHL